MDADTTLTPESSDSPLDPTRRALLLLSAAGVIGGGLASLIESEAAEAKKERKKKKRKKKRRKNKNKNKNKNKCNGSVGGNASDAEEQELLKLINNFRQTQGVTPPLTRNSQLDTAARLHSQDMAKRCYFDHVSPDGSDPGDRIAATGYQANSWAENIYKGSGNLGSAAQAFEAWKDSPGHRANMLSDVVREIGIGTALDGSGYMIWTNVFGRRRPA